MADRETIRQQMKADGVEYILAQFIDIHGSPKVKMVPVAHFDAVSYTHLTLPTNREV